MGASNSNDANVKGMLLTAFEITKDFFSDLMGALISHDANAKGMLSTAFEIAKDFFRTLWVR